MRYLVTGGAGFVGTHLTVRLVGEGHRVTVLDSRPDGCPPVLAGLGPGLRYVRGSVTDTVLVAKLVAEADYVIHLAAVVGVRLAMARGVEGLRVGCLGTEAVLDAACRAGREVFIASSSAVYGKVEATPVAEEADTVLGPTSRPSWLYSVGKLAEEHLALAYARERGARVKIGRFFNVIGPHQMASSGMVVPSLVTRALRGEPLLVYGDGSQTRTFCYVDDAVEGLRAVAERGEAAAPYNIGGSEEVTMLELARRVKLLTDSSSPVEAVPYALAFGPRFEETPRRAPNLARIRGLGYSPRYSLDEALSRIIDHHRRSAGRE